MNKYTFRHCPKGHYYQGDECPYCKAQMANKLKECPNGHYYQGDACPYCKHEPERPEAVLIDDLFVHHGQDGRGCPNGHAYDKRLSCCPYCGEIEVDGVRIELVSTVLRCNLSIGLKREMSIRLDGKLIGNTSRIDVSWNQFVRYRHRNGYTISCLPNFDYKSKIEIGGIEYTGKQIINLIDYLIDNVKDYKIAE